MHGPTCVFCANLTPFSLECVRRAVPADIREQIEAFFLGTSGADAPHSALLLQNLGVDDDLPPTTEPQRVADAVLGAKDAARIATGGSLSH